MRNLHKKRKPVLSQWHPKLFLRLWAARHCHHEHSQSTFEETTRNSKHIRNHRPPLKLIRVIPKSRAFSTHATIAFFDHWTVHLGIQYYILKEQGSRFVGMLFAAMCSYLGVGHVTTFAYNSHATEQAN